MHCQMRKKRPTRDSDFSAIAVPSMHGSGYLDYTVETHASKSLEVMEEFRRKEMLCDLVLHVTHKERTVDFKVRRPLNHWFSNFSLIMHKVPSDQRKTFATTTL